MPSTEAYIVLLAGKPTASVERGFLPAAAELGLRVVLLTDRPDAYQEALQAIPAEHRPGLLVECDLTTPAAVIDGILGLEGQPAAIFSNSDHLQMVTAIAAAYFGLPGKDWRAAHRCKNKAAMRRHLAEQEIDALWFMITRGMDESEALAGFPRWHRRISRMTGARRCATIPSIPLPAPSSVSGKPMSAPLVPSMATAFP